MNSNSNSGGEAPKLHIDTDWKSQARAEKEKLAQQAQAKQAPQSAPAPGTVAGAAGAQGPDDLIGDEEGTAAEGGRGMPPADFKTLVSTMVTQALFALGAIPDPQTGQRMAHLDLAAHHIDMLTVIEQKTKGNLDAEEAALIGQAVRELRSHFLELSKAIMARQSKQASAGGGPGLGGLGGLGGLRGDVK